MAEEKLRFQAEVGRLLDIVANSLYSEKEIFLRELISNASDACDRLRYLALTQPALAGGEGDYRIVITPDREAGTLRIADNGIGMNRDDLVSNLGTIARSGTAAFVESLAEASPDGATPGKAEDDKEGNDKEGDGEAEDAVTQIGQFGVGFYSAFMVAGQVEVASRKAGEKTGWRWTSDGRGSFTVVEADDAPARGSSVTLHLKHDAKEYLEPERLRHIVRTYSDHITFPIALGGAGGEGDVAEETVNQASAIWTRSKSEITDEQYNEFYRHVGHAFDEPWMRLHFRAEGMIEYAGLLFIPSRKPMDLFHPDRKNPVKLYVKRVFIADDCEDLVPAYLRFLRGVIDSEDLPLNVSRELLQDNPLLRKIRGGVVKRVLGELKKKAEKEPESYLTFWDSFGPVLKEGLYEDNDQRETLLALSRFASTAGAEPVSLADYVGRMKDGQEAIYYMTGEARAGLEKSPQLEGFAAKGVEVLLLTDPVDEFWIPSVGAFEGKPFKSVTRGGADLGKLGKDGADDAKGKGKAEDATENAGGIDALLAFIRLTLKDEVKDVRGSERLTESPVCLVADDGDMDIHLERLLKQHGQLDRTQPRVLELNPKHPLILRMNDRIGGDGAGGELEDLARLLLDQARIVEGDPVPDPAAFAKRLASFAEKGLG